MAGVREGGKAPKFKLLDKDGIEHGVGVTEGELLVVFFYPKDDTPGCTVEAKELSAALKDFSRRSVKLIGVSGGDERSKEKFCRKHNLKIDLVSDPDFSVSRAYGVFGEKKFMGRTYEGIHRRTFIIGKDRKILKIFSEVTPKGHAEEILSEVDRIL